ncbi:MAG TPA: ATP-binding protein [Steroidobacteraceae bacterium]|jgi:signal transduction histidine kinase/AmiR/NasT family two-component response regulator|nr:ATP-binding protein [Steroidobacteraceae bacterium]
MADALFQPESAGNPNSDSLRVLIFAPPGADSNLPTDVLSNRGIAVERCHHEAEACRALREGAGVLLLTREALNEDTLALKHELAAQESWSDVPVILLTEAGQAGSANDWLMTLPGSSGYATLIERPCHSATLLSAVQFALRARRKQYEARDLLDSERAARAEAESANRIKDEFLCSLSHELRTPLAVVLSWTRILQKKFGTLDPQLRQGLSIVTDSATNQARLISDLLDMSRIISGELTLEPRPTELVGLVTTTLDGQRAAAEAKGVQLIEDLSIPSAAVHADGSRLQQVFWNLLSNAIKFTPQGGCITVSIDTPRPASFEVRVADTGEGIDTDFLPKVFDHFSQADNSISRRHGGLGLGLAITRQLVEMHGGQIAAHSAGPGQGSTFVVSLPALSAEGADDGSELLRLASPTDMQPTALAGIRVLAVEDQPQMLELVRRTLEEYGAETRAVGSGHEALDLLRDTGCDAQHFDVLLSDIGMPKLDGFGLLRAVRNELAIDAASLPAIAVTAFARPEDRRRLLAAGFQAHLTKPYQIVQLVSAIRRLAAAAASRPKAS